MTYARAVDANQAILIAAFRRLGCTVQTLHTVGKGCPDFVVGYRGRNYMIEAKDGGKAPSQRKLTAAEQVWHDAWRGQVAICESLDDVASLVSAWEAGL